jgi:hypothetical protein
LRLPFSRKLSIVYATALVVAVEVLVHVGRVDRASRWLGVPLLDDPGLEELPPLEIASLAPREQRALAALAWVQRAWLWDATCLRRSLAGGWVLRGRQPRLCLGLAGTKDAGTKDPGAKDAGTKDAADKDAGTKEFVAHAWIVVDGHSLDGLVGAPLFIRPERAGTTEDGTDD